jgi:hypothetical protein
MRVFTKLVENKTREAAEQLSFVLNSYFLETCKVPMTTDQALLEQALEMVERHCRAESSEVALDPDKWEAYAHEGWMDFTPVMDHLTFIANTFSVGSRVRLNSRTRRRTGGDIKKGVGKISSFAPRQGDGVPGAVISWDNGTFSTSSFYTVLEFVFTPLL